LATGFPRRVMTISSPCSTRSSNAPSRFFASNVPTSAIQSPKLDLLDRRQLINLAMPRGVRACLPRPPPSAANTPPHRPRGSRRGGGSGSYSLAGGQTQAFEVEGALLRITPMRGARHYDEGDLPHPLDRLARLVEPPHMRIARDKEAIGRHPVRPLLQRPRSEEHTSELQSRENLVCRLL